MHKIMGSRNNAMFFSLELICCFHYTKVYLGLRIYSVGVYVSVCMYVCMVYVLCGYTEIVFMNDVVPVYNTVGSEEDAVRDYSGYWIPVKPTVGEGKGQQAAYPRSIPAREVQFCGARSSTALYG